MIINTSKVKTEALLLFTRDLIDSYTLKEENIFDLSLEVEEFVTLRISQVRKALDLSLQPIAYYQRNQNVSRIALIIKAYEFIKTDITKSLQKDKQFNPSMLCFTLLSTWFAELGKAVDSKEFLYFNLYPYSEIYDVLLVKMKDKEYKQLNRSMLQIAEQTIVKLNYYGFK